MSEGQVDGSWLDPRPNAHDAEVNEEVIEVVFILIDAPLAKLGVFETQIGLLKEAMILAGESEVLVYQEGVTIL